jgi:DNA-binding IclR family transcriptional regulator
MKGNVQYINSLDRGLRIIDMIASKGYAGTTDVGEFLGVNKSSAYRLLSTLERRGYVEQDRVTKMYKLSTKFIEISEKVLSNLDIIGISGPYLCELANNTGETSHLGIISKTRAVLVSQEKGKEMVSVNTRIGMSEPAHISAIGRAIISFLPEREQGIIIEDISGEIFRAQGNKKKEDIISFLGNIIKETHNRGYAIDDEELFSGIRCVAVPVIDHRRYPIASIGISGPSSRVTMENIDEYAAKVMEVANIITRKIGGSPLNS